MNVSKQTGQLAGFSFGARVTSRRSMSNHVNGTIAANNKVTPETFDYVIPGALVPWQNDCTFEIGIPMPYSAIKSIFLLALALMVGIPCVARAETSATCSGTITSLPAVISTPGTWCMKYDLSSAYSSADAITINTNNVTIDCNNFKIDGIGAGLSTTAHGISAANRLNVTVRHCHVRGFATGTYITGSSGGGHLIEDNHFDSNTWMGIWIEGDGSEVRRNRVTDTGLSTVFGNPTGIYTYYSVNVLDNTVSDVQARTGSNGYANGIFTTLSVGGSVDGNRVRGLVKDGAGIARGIVNNSDTRVTVRSNDLVGDASAGSLAISCVSSNSTAKDNVMNGFATGITTCTNSGGNNVIP